MSEVEKFNNLASQWWDTDGPLKTLHDINTARFEFIKTFISNLNDLNILDIGCGGGILTESLAASGANTTGIDLAEDSLKIAREHAKQQKLTIDYQVSNSHNFASLHTGKFDCVTCLELLEHVPDPAELVHDCAQLVKPGGYVFFSTVNRTWQAYLKAILAAEYVLQLLPKNTHDYDKFIRPAELDSWARQTNLSLITIKGLSYQPFTRKAKLSSVVNVNYITCYNHILASFFMS